MVIVFIRAIILYSMIIFAVRLMGKKQLGQLQPSELVITILVSNIATLPIEDTSLPMLMGIIPILVLVCLDVIMSGATLKWHKLRRIVSGSPKIIIKDGKIDQNQMRILRFTIDDIMESLHSYNIFDISEVQFAVVETTGQISVYQKFRYQNVTNEQMDFNKSEQDPPYVVIDDGIIINDSLDSLGINEEWVEKIIKEKGLEVKEVFLLTVSPDRKYKIIEKDKTLS